VKKLILMLLLLLGSAFVLAQEDSPSENLTDPARPSAFCGGLSDSRCFSKPINSLCTRDPRTGQIGICRPTGTLEDEAVTCVCI